MADEPWLKYQSPEVGPWAKYQVQPTTTAPKTAGYADKVSSTGAAFDKAAGTGWNAVGNTAAAALDIGTHAVTGVAGDLAGAATSIVTQDPKRGESVRQKVSDIGAPSTQSGKAAEQYVGALTEPVAKVLDYIPKKLEESGHPILGQTARAAQDVIGGGKALETKEASAVAKAAPAVEAGSKAELIGQVKKLGLKLTSQDVGAPIGKRVEAFASRPQLEREISVANAAQAKKAAAADVGIKGELSKGSINEGINKALVDYKAPRKLGRVDLASDETWKGKLKEIEGTSQQEEIDYPEDVNSSVQKEIAKFDKPNVDADSMVSKIAKLRERASDNFSGNADDKALARAQRKLATAMEEAIERHGERIGQSGTIEKFRAARVQLAKLYTIRDALTEGGELDLGVLEKELNKGEKLTGNLLTLAKAKSVFDRSFQNPENIRGHPVGVGDVALGMVGAASHGPLGVGLAAARPVTRAVMASKPYQKRFIKPHTIKDLPAKKRASTLQDME